jgi:hypothetical protein
VILAGKPPFPEYAEKCKTIQSIVIQIIQHRDFEGDEKLIPSMDIDSYLEFFPSDDKGDSRGRPSHYVEYMSELFHLALTILVNALEVVSCFTDQPPLDGVPVAKVVERFLEACSRGDSGVGIYQTLIDCVRSAERKQASGYLACKALRLFAMALPEFREIMKQDEKATEYIARAIRVGHARHALLKAESEKLWDCL